MFDQKREGRRSVRIPGYDYSQPGWYFITICTAERECLLGEVVDGTVRLNELGRIVANEWAKNWTIRLRLREDAFVVMPNHLHGVISIEGENGRGTLQRAPTSGAATESFSKPTPDSVPTIVRLFKAATTKRINELRGTPGTPVWQRNYYEHIVRDDDEL